MKVVPKESKAGRKKELDLPDLKQTQGITMTLQEALREMNQQGSRKEKEFREVSLRQVVHKLKGRKEITDRHQKQDVLNNLRKENRQNVLAAGLREVNT